jgi:two-component system response regulator HydG
MKLSDKWKQALHYWKKRSMLLQSLKSKLLFTAFILVISTGTLISILVTQRYSSILFETMTAQAENLTHAIALEASDKILINDLVSLQKMLENQSSRNKAIAYLFVSREREVLAHTFSGGMPSKLLLAHTINQEDKPSFQRIDTTAGEHYLDIAWPILNGKAGVLRLGFSEMSYRTQLSNLWIQMGSLTLGVLLLALIGAQIFIKRVTNPIKSLVEATQKIEKGNLGVRVKVQRQDELGRLSSSFNHMVQTMESYTGKLEEQTMELERSYQQTRISCKIVREIGALNSLNETGALLIQRIEEILKCRHMILLVLNDINDSLFIISSNGARASDKKEAIQTLLSALEKYTKVTLIKDKIFRPPIVPPEFQKFERQAIVPLRYEEQPFGALIIACPGSCSCNIKEVDNVGMILTQAAGVIKRAVLQEEETRNLENRMDTTTEFCGIVGKDPKMQIIYKLIQDIAPSDASVLIQGESGTGKELVARAIHQKSHRKDKPFIVINCSAYPATLLESELFGHEKGSFTGALRKKPGRFEQAHGGTVFLDEIGEISLSAQLKLLRVIQIRSIKRVGGEELIKTNIRIISATNKNLLQEVNEGHIREDLFYRLNVIPINMPPLRNRRNDILLLAPFFANQFSTQQGKKYDTIDPETMRILLNYSWPGNVRELENCIEHAIVLAKGNPIEPSHLPAMIHDIPGKLSSFAESASTMEYHERELLRKTLEECSWNKKLAAQHLGISRNTLYVKLKKYQITRPTTH